MVTHFTKHTSLISLPVISNEMLLSVQTQRVNPEENTMCPKLVSTTHLKVLILHSQDIISLLTLTRAPPHERGFFFFFFNVR